MSQDIALTLQPHYSQFNVSERILLSGHSHQAWPDVAKQGLLNCFDDAAKHIDDKWQAAFEKADRVRGFYRGLLGDPKAQIALGASTHELLLRFLSDLNCFKQSLRRPIKIVTTDGEFHSLRRQLNRLKDLNVNIEVVSVHPSSTLAERLIDKLDAKTDAVMVSAVFFGTSEIFKDVGLVAKAADSLNIPCLVDAYHALNVVPFDLNEWQLASAFVVAGGYKYCQAGEGNCMMRIPQNYQGSPIITGWYAEFDVLNQAPGKVGFGPGQSAFAGSTYDPSSHYRAAEVFDFFEAQNLTDIKLRKISQQQISLLWQGIESMGVSHECLGLPSHAIADNAGFLSLTTANASTWVKELGQLGILCDSRGNQLRFGPAPYVTKAQLDQALNVVEDLATRIG
ncbi:kynureninase [Shewanella eurypsychrophilus]|uniref:Kynureninase n=1 Tax=Shewanella eurypsychrophilus TaxID=2593656 RepID=A0ABX6V5H7_9GAMM|nr:MULTISPECIES: kynureninase [Shewanella]QFU21937.1 kynureninase [Shewanella sp. YLB-09]QPG57226.1 kynureninase [Shewanella eurypsychrophilus]